MRNIRIQLLVVGLLLLGLVIIPVEAQDFGFTGDVQKVELSNGITVLIKENPAVDIVSMVLLSNVGTAYDPQGLSGLTYLTQQTMMKGTESLNSQELALALESQGISMAAQTSFEMSALVFQSTTKGFETAVDLFWDVLKHPVFPEAEVDWAKQLAFYGARSLADQPINEVVWTFFAELYGDSGYGRPPIGLVDTIPQLTLADVREWYSVIYQPENLVISVVGNVETAKVVVLLEAQIGQWQPQAPSGRLTINQAKFQPATKTQQKVINKPTQAAWMVIGYPAPSSQEEDKAAMAVLNAMLGGGMGSRLFTEVRDKRGLAYAIQSGYDPNFGPSCIFAFLGTHPSQVDEARSQVLAQFNRFAQEEVTDEELQTAITLVRGQYLMQNETNATQAVVLSINELLGPGYAWADEYPRLISAVTKADVQAVAQKYFQGYVEALIVP